MVHLGVALIDVRHGRGGDVVRGRVLVERVAGVVELAIVVADVRHGARASRVARGASVNVARATHHPSVVSAIGDARWTRRASETRRARDSRNRERRARSSDASEARGGRTTRAIDRFVFV